tara:strand:+ start:600 stop:1082 length:483 start_codon:yes stop_codon:yes gene_type:complete
MTISVGDKIPVVDLNIMTDDGPQTLSTNEIFTGKKIALFGLPGAFTRTCSARHLPGFIDNAEIIKAKGITTIACISVNDIFVMNAWGKAQGTENHIMMLADGSAKFAQATELDVDMSDKGFGVRCKRFSMIVDNCVIKNLNVDAQGVFEVSSAEVMLGEL